LYPKDRLQIPQVNCLSLSEPLLCGEDPLVGGDKGGSGSVSTFKGLTRRFLVVVLDTSGLGESLGVSGGEEGWGNQVTRLGCRVPRAKREVLNMMLGSIFGLPAAASGFRMSGSSE